LVRVSVCNISAEEKRKDIHPDICIAAAALFKPRLETNVFVFIYLPTLSRRSEEKMPWPNIKYYFGISEAPEECKEVPRSEQSWASAIFEAGAPKCNI